MRTQQELKARVLALWKDEKKRVQLLLTAGLAGMLLLALSEWMPSQPSAVIAQDQPEAPSSSEGECYAQEMETRLTQLISRMEGVGDVRVMVTLAAGETTVYATDTETETEGSARTQHILLEDGTDPALVETVHAPQIQGVAVVCEGGGNAVVQSRITELVEALTGVGANHIAVTKMLAQGEEQP